MSHVPQVCRDARRSRDWAGALWPVSVAAVSAILCAPFLRYVDSLGDEGVLLHGAQRILMGEMVYRDFFAVLPPGGFATVALWLAHVGDDLATVRFLAILVIAGIAVLTFHACRVVTGDAMMAALLTIAWVATTQGQWTVVNHHWLTTAHLMAAYCLVLRALRSPERAAGWALAGGVLIGAAGMTTSTRGAAGAVVAATILLSSHGLPRRAVLSFCAGVAAVPALLAAWLAWHGALDDGAQQFVVFAGGRYSAIQAVPFGHWASAKDAPVVLLYPLTALMVVVAALFRGGRIFGDAAFRAALLFGAMAWLTSYPRPDVIHLYFTAPLALPLLAASVRLVQAELAAVRRWVVLAGLAAVMVPAVAAWLNLSDHVRSRPVVQTERGLISPGRSSGGAELQGLLLVLQRVPRDDRMFFYPYDPMLPYLTARAHVGRLDVFVPGYTSTEQYLAACREVLERARWLVFDREWASPEFLRTMYPAIAQPAPPEKLALEGAMFRAFAPVFSTPRFALLRRDDHVELPAGTCSPAARP